MWYETKVKYLKIDQEGYERKATDTYLLDAVSYTDAETRIFEIMKEITRGDFQVIYIKRSNVTEIISKDDGEFWYKAKINLMSIDEESGKERKLVQYVLVMGNSLNDAEKQLTAGLSYMIVPYVSISISLSKVVDVFPYIEPEN